MTDFEEEIPHYVAVPQRDGNWRIIDTVTGEPVVRSGLILINLSRETVPGLIDLLETFDNGGPTLH